MSYEAPLAGYVGKVYATCWQAAAWLSSVLQSGAVSSPAAIATPALAVFQTLTNGADAVAAWQTGAMMAQEQRNMASIEALPLTLDAPTLAYLNARVASITAAANGLAALPPAVSPISAVSLLSAGQPAVPDPGFLEWCVAFGAEAPPVGTTPATLVAAASGAATAWQAITNAILVVQGTALTTAYDTAARQYRVASGVANGLAFLASATGGYAQASVPALWNGAVAMPSLLLDASTLMSSPAWAANQQGATVRFALRSLAVQVAYLLLSLRAPITSTATTAALRRNETLMDLAARAGGGYEEWAAVAALNAISPPWPGPTNQNVAASGTSLLMPGSSVPPSGTPAPTYAVNVLGVDFDFGPINGPQPAWNGDIPLIVGYANLARALGRRIQTPLGTLIYHPQYGSRIPPEVGAVQDSTEAQRLAAFGGAALAADPRVASVLSATASVQPGFLATFSGAVSPVGPGSSPVSINETISPLP
jgi:hypothetical protein